MTHKLTAAATFALVFASPLAAKDAFELPVTGEILPGWVQADGTRMAGIRLTLSPGWKTYWRSPGDAGIPPRFNWSKSDNLHSVGVVWPAPEVFMTAGMRTIGYTGDVVLPISLAPKADGGPIELNATIDMGVCSDICVPHRMNLSAVIEGNETRPTPAIAAALAARPYSGGEAGVTAASCSLSPIEDGLAIKATINMPSAGGDEIVIVEPGQPGLWMSETTTTRSGSTLVAVGEMATSDGKPVAIKRSDVKITVLGKTHAVEIQGC